MMNLGTITSVETINGAKVLLETLKTLGVDTMFGYPGGIVLEIYDELFKQSSIKHILCGHEQACIHAAEGYARISGKCGVVIVTSGPGATNLVTGIANAYIDGFPLVILTGQVNKDLIGKDAFQEVNIIDITNSCTKKNFQVTDINELQNTIIEAFNIANSGKKGPVLVDVSKNVFSQFCKFEDKKITTVNKDEINNFSKNNSFITEKFLYLLKNSKKPVIITGAGIRHSCAGSELANFVNSFKIPVVSTMMGLGCFDYKNPLYYGMIGIFGSKSANDILRQSDLIISLGARLNDRITCCFKNNELEDKIIQIDINKNQFGKFYRPLLTINADVKEFLKTVNLRHYSERKLEILQYPKDTNEKSSQNSEFLGSKQIIEAVWEYTKDFNFPVTTEVGQHQLWCAKYYKFNYPEQFLTSGGLGAMGFGFPAAIGASIACNGSPVICFAGDGSFQMNLQELSTLVNYNLPVKIMLMDNGYLGMVRQLQEKNCEGRYSQTKINNPDFVKLCSSYGIKAVRVETSEQIAPALEECFSNNKPFLIDFVTEPMELV